MVVKRLEEASSSLNVNRFLFCKYWSQMDIGMITISDIIGISGVTMVLLSYFFLQIGKVSSNDLSYSVINLVSSVMIIVSLLENWNLASVIIEIAWFLISCYGVYRYLKRRRQKVSASA